jgi:hypothetical protein
MRHICVAWRDCNVVMLTAGLKADGASEVETEILRFWKLLI